MEKAKKIVKYSLYMIILGLILSIAGLAMGANLGIINGNSGYEIFDEKDKVKKNEDLSAFTSIEVNANFDNIDIIKSDKYAIETEYVKAHKSISYSVSEGGKLLIEDEGPKKIRLTIGYAVAPSSIKIYVPQGVVLDSIDVEASSTDLTINSIKSNKTFINCKYGKINISDLDGEKVEIDSNNNDITMKNLTTKDIIIRNEYGDIKSENINTNDFNVGMNNGYIEINNLISKNSASVESQYGDIVIKNSEFNKFNNYMNNGTVDMDTVIVINASVDNKYGEINLNNFKSNGIEIEGSNSDINLSGEFKGNTIIKSGYGDVTIKTNIAKELYNYNILCNYGDIKIDNEKFEKNFKNNDSNKENSIDVDTNNGDVTIDFN